MIRKNQILTNEEICGLIQVYEIKEITTNTRKKRENFLIKCNFCEKLHYKERQEILSGLRNNSRFFCSIECFGKFNTKALEVICANCNKKFIKELNAIKNTNNNFCSRSCAATYNNKNKKYGTRRSKLEIFLEENTKKNYPNLIMLCNNREAIGSELDFYFPELKLAIQINGITHYEPIYGNEKFFKIKKSDEEKRSECLNNNIKLIEINCSTDSYLNKSLKEMRWIQFKKFLDEAIF